MQTDLTLLNDILDYHLSREEVSAVRNAIAELEELRRGAEYRKANPLGGPGKVFDAMADRIRAGDDYYEVLADYGFQVIPPHVTTGTS